MIYPKQFQVYAEQYRIETKGPFQLVCCKMKDPRNIEMTTEQIIRQFWKERVEDGTTAALEKYISEKGIFGNSIVGASFGLR